MGRIPGERAGYMQLRGAVKDGECTAVAVRGGISLELGCCNHFEPEDESVEEFRCGECEYHMNLKQEATGDDFGEPLSSDESSAPSFPAYKNKALMGSHALTPFKTRAVKIKSQQLASAISRSRRAKQGGRKWG